MQIYLVGGAVRDRLLGLECEDKDYVVVGANADEMLSLGYTQVGSQFPVFLHPDTHAEYALARTERKSGLGYKGFICDFSPDVSLDDDLIRRDLTINAIAYDEANDTYIDPTGGLYDLKNRVLRHISPAFCEDPLRILRVCRFAAKLHGFGFKIAQQTLDLMQSMTQSGELATLTPERVFLEIEKALNTPSPAVFFYLLHSIGALEYIMPELEALHGVPGPKKWHPEIDSFVHTMMALDRISYYSEDSVTRFAVLCHDLGKALTPKELWPHHPDHGPHGIGPLKTMCARLKVPRAYEDFASVVVYYHSFIHHLYDKGAEGIVSHFEDLDGYRRPERIKPFALCCKADFLGRKGFENRPFPRSDYFLAMFSLTNTVKAAEFVAQGLKGPAIKEAMHQKRVELVTEFLKILPKTELDGSANALPPDVLQSLEIEKKKEGLSSLVI